MAERWILRGARVLTPDGIAPRSIVVEGGRIAAVRAYDDVAGAARVVEAGTAAVLPGIVDSHVHINEPGRTEWEGFASATRAAVAGGVTTLVDMPLNSIPATTTAQALQVKRAATEGQLSADVGFWGGVVPGNGADLEPLWTAGVLGFKCFLVPSGVAEFQNVGEADLAEALPLLARLGAPLLVHAELPGPIERAAELESCATWDGRAYACYVASRPPEAELEAIALMLRLARSTGARVHIVHLSASEAIPMLEEAREAGVPVTVETCPHYLHFDAEEIPDGACQYKCAPPIRDRANKRRLWDGLRDGVIDLVATDHSPCPSAMKRLEEGDFTAAWGGVASLQLGLAVTWTGARRRGFGLEDIARWMCAAPARLAGLEARKGTIAPGRDADLVVFEPDAEFVVEAAKLYHRHPTTPYAGARLAGVVRRTYLRGVLAYEHGQGPGTPTGRILDRIHRAG